MPQENFPREDVEKQAALLRAFWRRRGYEVKTEVVPMEKDPSLIGKKRTTGFRLVTDMVNGYPRELCRERTAAAKVAKGVHLV